MKKTLVLLFLAVISLSPACKKSTQPDPCAGFADMPAPARIGIVFVDKSTGENVLLSKNIDPKTITITPAAGFYVGSTVSSDDYGALTFYQAQYEKGAFSYTINIPGEGTFTVTYTNKEKITGNPCHPVRIIVGEPTVQGYTYTTIKTGSPFIIKLAI